MRGTQDLQPGWHMELPDLDVDVVEEALVAVAAAAVRRLVRQLPPVERYVIAWRFGLLGSPQTLDEVGARIGMTRASAWRVERRALQHLRELAS